MTDNNSSSLSNISIMWLLAIVLGVFSPLVFYFAVCKTPEEKNEARKCLNVMIGCTICAFLAFLVIPFILYYVILIGNIVKYFKASNANEEYKPWLAFEFIK